MGKKRQKRTKSGVAKRGGASWSRARKAKPARKASKGAARARRPKMGRKKHPQHLRTETIGFALYEEDKKTLLKGCKLRDISKSSAFRLAIRGWAKGGFKLDARAVQDKARGNKDPVRMAREAAAATKRRAARKKAPRAPKALPTFPPAAPEEE